MENYKKDKFFDFISNLWGFFLYVVLALNVSSRILIFLCGLTLCGLVIYIRQKKHKRRQSNLMSFFGLIFYPFLFMIADYYRYQGLTMRGKVGIILFYALCFAFHYGFTSYLEKEKPSQK